MILPELRAPRIAMGAGLTKFAPQEANVVIANAFEARRMTGHRDLNKAAQELARTRRLACITDGANGALAVGGNQTSRAEPPARHHNGRRGAGDAFTAAFLVALAEGRPTLEALEAGCEAGARAAAARVPLSMRA
jgi:sugar/nucleoside kinase (ribokinase family)